jgi:hypothetical protein
MKSFEQLAKAAYEAGQQSMRAQNIIATRAPAWSELPPSSQQVWVEVARTVVQEMATVQ